MKKMKTEAKKKAKFHRFIPDTIPLKEMVRLLERFNRANKRCYTYGQFVSLINSGKITKEELDDIQRKERIT